MRRIDMVDGGVSRRRFLIASGALGAGALAAGTPSWPACANPNFTPPSDCGNPTDTGNRFSLWDDVKNATPSNPHSNLAVVIPDAKKAFGYAVKNGDPGGKMQYNLLFIPAPVSKPKMPQARITGVECPRILQPDALNLWHFAWQEAKTRFKAGTDLMLGINAKDGRQKDQLHIHLTAFHEDARKTLNGLTIPTDLSAWNTSAFVVMDNVYRIVRIHNLDTNVFELVHKHVATTGKNNDMFQQALAVVSAPNNGFYVLNTQGKPDTTAGQPEHIPELRQGKYFGSSNIERLIYRG
ncbi:MAG: CDP-diacylglycerol diphosphatase [Nocardiaceae bacterium]|nr:CDP-diacylglycerol diphosphatase [Nocardiaceae bacterium]